MKIYSGFTFFNELELLELRLKEMSSYIDYFVIVESNYTFRNKPKQYILEQNWDQFAQWHDQIIYIKVDDMPLSDNPWDNETFQRNAIVRGLKDAAADDVVLIGDVDEIVRCEAINQVRNTPSLCYSFAMPLFNFRYNYMLINHAEHMNWVMGCRCDVLDQVSPNELRAARFSCAGHPNFVNISHAGWHFTWLGDDEAARLKLASFSHSEADIPEVRDQLSVEESIRLGMTLDRRGTPERYSPVIMDWYMPKTLRNNPEKYSKWIIPNATRSAVEFLPKWYTTDGTVMSSDLLDHNDELKIN
jgi:beta-1,4-mannosyl-glycoprotein beta-1,4-N-acetylglucosaminyltransferase